VLLGVLVATAGPVVPSATVLSRATGPASREQRIHDEQLFLLRQAKSSWNEAELADHDRPLTPRGRHAVKLIAEHLQQTAES